jgi:hypothetical protein
VDKSILDTVCRETFEESNGVFSKEDVRNIIKNICPIYFPRGKYLLYISKIEKFYDPEDFGYTEIHTGFHRTIEWVPFDQLLSRNFANAELHPRLDFEYLESILLEINNKILNN